MMADETRAMPPLRITAWGEGWEKTEYIQVDAFSGMTEKKVLFTHLGKVTK
jgi:hypothetical protein